MKKEVRLIIKTSVATLLIVLIVLEFLMFFYVREFGVFYRPLTFVKDRAKVYFSPADPKLDKVIRSSISGDWRKEQLEDLSKLIWPVVKEKKTDWEKAVALRSWVRSQAHKLKPLEHSNDPIEILRKMNNGEGGSCGDFAELYMAAAQSIGLPARRVQLLRNPPWDRYDTHVVTEIFIDRKWMLMDPTFDIHFVINKTVATAKDVQDYFLSAREKRPLLEVIRGEKEFHPTFEEYYLNSLSLYNNVVYMFDATSKSPFLFKLPPFRHFDARRRLVIQDENRSAFMLLNDIVFLYDFILPAMISCLGCILITMYFYERRNKTGTHKRLFKISSMR